MLTGVNLPEELIPEILSRLPAKPLGRFKCVSKPWRTLISDPKFIKTHLSQTNRLHCRSVIFAPIFRPLLIVDFEGYQFTQGRITSELEFEQPSGWLGVCGSCDGLILALTGQYKLCLLNPITRECKILPSPNSFMLGVAPSGIYGLGYDSLTHDYKVVIFCINFVWVYMLRNNCWKMVQYSPFYWFGSKVLHSEIADSGVFVNGSVHLLCRKNRDSPLSIVAFNLADEMFREVPPPCELTGETQLDVWVLSGFLCLTNSTTDIWVMREYGVKESWNRFSIYQPRRSHIRPVLLSGDKDFLLIMNKEKLVVYNVKEKTSRDINCHGLLVKGNFDVRTFAGSLVSPKQWD